MTLNLYNIDCLFDTVNIICSAGNRSLTSEVGGTLIPRYFVFMFVQWVEVEVPSGYYVQSLVSKVEVGSTACFRMFPRVCCSDVDATGFGSSS